MSKSKKNKKKHNKNQVIKKNKNKKLNTTNKQNNMQKINENITKEEKNKEDNSISIKNESQEKTEEIKEQKEEINEEIVDKETANEKIVDTNNDINKFEKEKKKKNKNTLIKKLKNKWIILIICVIVVSIFMIIFINRKNLFVSNNQDEQVIEEEQATIPEEYKCYFERSAKIGDLQFTFQTSDENFMKYKQGAKVKDGYSVLKVSFEIENMGNEIQNISTDDFICIANSEKCDNFVEAENVGFPKNQLSANEKENGTIYYQIPVNSEKINVEYSPKSEEQSGQKIVFVVRE